MWHEVIPEVERGKWHWSCCPIKLFLGLTDHYYVLKFLVWYFHLNSLGPLIHSSNKKFKYFKHEQEMNSVCFKALNYWPNKANIWQGKHYFCKTYTLDWTRTVDAIVRSPLSDQKAPSSSPLFRKFLKYLCDLLSPPKLTQLSVLPGM